MTKEQIEAMIDENKLQLAGAHVTDADVDLIPAGVTYLLFDSCPGLTDALVIPAGVTDLLFYNCPGLTDALVIPAGVTDLRFYNCPERTDASRRG